MIKALKILPLLCCLWHSQMLAQQATGFVQKDLSALVATLSTHTDSARYSAHDHSLWQQYLCRPHPNVALMRQYFDRAAQEFGVPSILLQAIAQIESNWTQIGPSIDHGWGVMHLVDNDYAHSLQAAAKLLGVSTQTLKDDAQHNIRGMAALIAQEARQQQQAPKRLEDWYAALLSTTGLYNKELSAMQVHNYYTLIRQGHRSPTLWNEEIVIAAQPDIDISQMAQRHNRWLNTNTAAKTTDYAAAIPSFISHNYSPGRAGYQIDCWVNHWIGTGTYAGAISWFHNSAARASAHFVIRHSDGQITQCVRTQDMAWHAGATGHHNNQRSIGVEHEATLANPSQWQSAPMLNASATMAKYFCGQHAIARTRSLPGIRGHHEMPGTATACPGNLPWDTWMHLLTLEPQSPAADSSLPAPITFRWLSAGGAGQSYQLQVAKHPSGWTPQDGFGSQAHSSAHPINTLCTTNTYLWNSTHSYPPQANTTYYWTVCVRHAGTQSYYSPPRRFNTAASSAPTEGVSLYPNPNRGQFTISFQNSFQGTYYANIYNSQGKLIKKLAIDKSNTTHIRSIHLKDARPGIYFLQLSSEGNSLVWKVVVW